MRTGRLSKRMEALLRQRRIKEYVDVVMDAYEEELIRGTGRLKKFREKMGDGDG